MHRAFADEINLIYPQIKFAELARVKPLTMHDEHFPVVPVALVIITGSFLAGMDAMAKYLALQLPIILILWGRYFFQTAITFGVFRLKTRSYRFLIARRPDLQFYRASCLFGATFSLYLSLRYMPLGDAASIQFLAPVLVTAFSGVFLGEVVGPRRRLAVVFGFVGVLLVTRPGTGVFGWVALLPLTTAFLLAGYFLLTRIIRNKDDSAATTFYSTALGTLVLSCVVYFYWQSLSPFQWMLMFAMGACGAIGHFMLVKAFHAAEASVLSPFTYAHVIFAIIWGFLVFDDVPSLWTISGASLVIGSGLYIWYRETRVVA
jgi:drug/metabolite transporter (DMT)-like permease